MRPARGTRFPTTAKQVTGLPRPRSPRNNDPSQADTYFTTRRRIPERSDDIRIRPSDVRANRVEIQSISARQIDVVCT